MNLVLLRTIRVLVLVFFINLTQYVVEGDGMIEVFGWKQMDFYNRGNNDGNIQIANRGEGSITTPLNREAGAVIFPKHFRHKRYNRGKPFREVFTSRDHPASTGASRRYNKNKSDGAGMQNSTSYIPYNNLPMGATHFNGRLFITMPRRRLGIPSTLNYVDLRKDGQNPSPKLYAYPNFDTNYLSPDLRGDPNRLISVYRTTVDECKRLWFIDTGMLELPDNRMQVKRPSVWIIDLTTDRVLQRFDIPEDIVDTGRGLASIAVDVNPINCGQAFAYIPDLLNRQLYVYSLDRNRIWAFSHNYLSFDPLGGDLNIGGQSFRWDDGIFSVTLGSLESNGYRTVYFHSLASNNEFFVNSEVLQNESNSARSDHGNDFQLLGSRGTNHQSNMHEYDPRTRILFYSEIQRNGVGCWNTNKPFSPENQGTVTQDPDRMIYPSDLTIDEDGTMWVMTNTMPVMMYSNLDTNIVNFRVWKQNVFEAAKNTVCE